MAYVFRMLSIDRLIAKEHEPELSAQKSVIVRFQFESHLYINYQFLIYVANVLLRLSLIWSQYKKKND